MSFGKNAPEGFVENSSRISATCNTQDSFHDIQSGYATSIFTGDPVTDAGGYIVRATPGTGAAALNAVTGVFKGVSFKDSNNELRFYPYWAASTVTSNTEAAKAYVIDDPYVVFTIQVGSSDATPPQATRVHLTQNANYSFGAGGNTFTGKSGAYLDIASVGTGATLNCKILEITPGYSAALGLTNFNPENALSQNYNNVNVMFNNHKYKGGTGTLGN